MLQMKILVDSSCVLVYIESKHLDLGPIKGVYALGLCAHAGRYRVVLS